MLQSELAVQQGINEGLKFGNFFGDDEARIIQEDLAAARTELAEATRMLELAEVRRKSAVTRVMREDEEMNETLQRLNPTLVVTTEGVEGLAGAFGELGDTIEEDVAEDAASVAGQLSSSWSATFTEFAKGAASATDAARDLLTALTDLLLNRAFETLLDPLATTIAGVLFPSAQGNAFMNGAPLAFASGGIVDSPTLFPMRGARTGLMGEAGPEAILPLTRINGTLGVRAESAGRGGDTVTLNFAPVIDARGADPAAVERIEANQQRMAAEFEGRVHSVLRVGRNTRRNRAWSGT